MKRKTTTALLFRSLLIIIAMALSLAAFSACGDSNTSPSAQPDPEADPEPNGGLQGEESVVRVELAEYTLVLDTSTVETGAVTFRATNVGTENHGLVILKTNEPADSLRVVDGLVDESVYEVVGRIDEFAPGLERGMTFRLEPGSYVLISNAQGHYEQGMSAPLEVTEVTGDLIIYSGREEELVGPLIEQFEEQTGLDVAVRYGSNSQLIATIFEEGGSSPADLFFGSDPGALGALSERLSPLPADLLERVGTPFRSPAGSWVGITGRARVVVYNTDVLSEGDIPDSILEFTTSEWDGRIGWAPTNGSFQSMVTAMRQLLGDDDTRAWLESIKANNPTDYPNNTAVVQAVGNGEVDVGFVNHYYLYRFLAEEGESFSARNAFMNGGDPGAIVLVAGVGILDSADHVPAAERFVDFLLSQEAQEYFRNETHEYPLIEGVEPEEGLVPLSEIEVPDLDLSDLEDLEGTLALLRDAGVLP